MSNHSIQNVTKALHDSWSADTAFDARDWSSDNPARGQCVVSCLIMQDYFGGDLIRYVVTGDNIQETHYANVLTDGTIVDSTGQQYKEPVSFTVKTSGLGEFANLRDKALSGGNTQTRYEKLRAKVVNFIASA